MKVAIVINISLVLLLGVACAFAGDVTASRGFDRPLVIDLKMERDIVALSKRVSGLELETKKKAKMPITPIVVDNKKVAGLQIKVDRMEKQISQLFAELANLRAKVTVLGKMTTK